MPISLEMSEGDGCMLVTGTIVSTIISLVLEIVDVVSRLLEIGKEEICMLLTERE